MYDYFQICKEERGSYLAEKKRLEVDYLRLQENMQHTIVKLELEAKQAVVDMEKKYVNLTLDGKKVREARTAMAEALSVWCAASSVCQHDRQLPDSFSQNKKTWKSNRHQGTI